MPARDTTPLSLSIVEEGREISLGRIEDATFGPVRMVYETWESETDDFRFTGHQLETRHDELEAVLEGGFRVRLEALHLAFEPGRIAAHGVFSLRMSPRLVSIYLTALGLREAATAEHAACWLLILEALTRTGAEN